MIPLNSSYNKYLSYMSCDEISHFIKNNTEKAITRAIFNELAERGNIDIEKINYIAYQKIDQLIENNKLFFTLTMTNFSIGFNRNITANDTQHCFDCYGRLYITAALRPTTVIVNSNVKRSF